MRCSYRLSSPNSKTFLGDDGFFIGQQRLGGEGHPSLQAADLPRREVGQLCGLGLGQTQLLPSGLQVADVRQARGGACQEAVDLPGYEPHEAADGLPLRLALAPLLLDVLPGPRVGEHPIQGDVVKRAVGPPVPSPVEAMPPALGRGGRDGGRAAHHGEGRQAPTTPMAQPPMRDIRDPLGSPSKDPSAASESITSNRAKANTKCGIHRALPRNFMPLR